MSNPTIALKLEEFQLLENVLKAGHAPQEQSVLLKRLNTVRELYMTKALTIEFDLGEISLINAALQMVLPSCEPEQAVALDNLLSRIKQAVPEHLPPPITIGTRLWRDVVAGELAEYKITTLPLRPNRDDPHLMPIAEKGGYMFRAIWKHWAATVEPIWIAVGAQHKGFVCFCHNRHLPTGWTYFEVTHLAKNGKACFVKPVVGEFSELLTNYTDHGKNGNGK